MLIADCSMVILPCRAARAAVSKTHIAAVFNNGNDTHYPPCRWVSVNNLLVAQHIQILSALSGILCDLASRIEMAGHLTTLLQSQWSFDDYETAQILKCLIVHYKIQPRTLWQGSTKTWRCWFTWTFTHCFAKISWPTHWAHICPHHNPTAALP